MHGNIVYIEFALIHEKETLDFYSLLFGFRFENSYLSKQRYIMFKTPDQGIIGAFDANQKPSLEGALVYLETEDIQNTLDVMQANFPTCAVLKEKTFISDAYGSYAVIVDPNGNRIGLQENSKPSAIQ